MNQVERLRDALAKRKTGVVHFDVRSLSQINLERIDRLVDSYVEQLGMSGIGSSWREIDSAAAKSIIHRILHRDLAYNVELMPEAHAESLSLNVLNLFGPKVRYFTNGTYEEDPQLISESVFKGPSWHPITEATFDTGVVFVDESKMGLIWVEDED